MTVVQPAGGDTVRFRMELSDDAGEQQKSLKAKIESTLDALEEKASDSAYPGQVRQLEEIAISGFDSAAADPVAASAEVDAFIKKLDLGPADEQQEPDSVEPGQRMGAFEVGLPDPTDESDKGIGWQEIIFNVTGDLVPVPTDQLKLKAEIEQTLTILQAILPDENKETRPKNMTSVQH